MMAVITISREYGSGGDQVAARLCEVLGYHAFGKAQIAQAAAETNMSKLNAVDYTEDNHEVQSFMDRLLGRSASSVQNIAWSENPSIATRAKRADVNEAAVISLVRRAIKAAVKVNNMVIVGRGGQVLLKDTPGVLHVRIEAPFELRIQRVVELMKHEQKAKRPEADLVRAAGDIIGIRDIASADYIRRFYNADWADPKLYHMVLNLGLFNVEQAAQIIVAAVSEIESQTAAV
jgi:CMP/dCMP kinase